jgi:hypothetical protein
MRAGNGNGLEEFYPYARKKVKTPQLLELLDEICLNPPKNKSAYEVYFKELEKIRL